MALFPTYEFFLEVGGDSNHCGAPVPFRFSFAGINVNQCFMFETLHIIVTLFLAATLKSAAQQGRTSVPKICEPPQNFRHQMGDIKQVVHGRPTYMRPRCTKFSGHGDEPPGICAPELLPVLAGTFDYARNVRLLLSYSRSFHQLSNC
jgi:hypothetical protein